MSRMEELRRRFALLASQPDDGIDLVEAALLIAGTAYPELDPALYRQRLDDLALRVRAGLNESTGAGGIVMQLNRILFDEEGFRDNQENYYDPQNSFLNRVLDRRMGIPISLSLVYAEVGRCAGFPFHGVALPGHFIVALFHTHGTLYIDPFHRGAILTETECRRMARQHVDSAVARQPDWMAPAGNKTILKRMLRNLKGIYRHLNQDLPAFEMIQWVLALEPDAPAELSERGALYEAMGNTALAVRDFEHYLQVEPDAENRGIIEEKIKALSNAPVYLH